MILILVSGRLVCEAPWPMTVPAFPCALSAVLCCGVLELTALSQVPQAVARGKSAQLMTEEENKLDATVWRDEVLAGKYERTFTRLRDGFIHSTNKLAILGEFDFDQIVLPAPKDFSRRLDLGIFEQGFDDARSAVLTRKDWQATLSRLALTGWKAVQAEWTHEKFIPPKEGREAVSGFDFELHGERAGGLSRFIVRGSLLVDWSSQTSSNDWMRPARLKVSNLKVYERAGPPGFSSHAVVTPQAPDQRGIMMNMHPLIVTDIDGNGSEDILMTGVNKLFLNDGAANFTPLDLVSEKVFRGSRDAGVIADFNGDGKLDFLTVAKEGALTNKLVLYPGNGAVPFSLPPVVAWEGGRLATPSVMTVADIDHDGDLDVWIGQYKPPYVGGQLPTPYYDANDGDPSFLLINDGHGKFTDATATAGLFAKSHRRTLAASFVDLNGDHHPDLLTVNDYAGADLYYNDGHGHFTDESGRLYNRHLFGMGHCFADFDGDGALDFLVIGMSVPTVRRLEFLKGGREDLPELTRKRVDMGYGNRVYVPRAGRWVKPAFADQLAVTGWSWGATAFDFNNDGKMDVYVANGHVSGRSTEDYASHIWTHDIYLGSSREDMQLLIYFDKPFRGLNTGETSSDGYQHNVLFMDAGGNEYVNVAFLMGVAHETDCRAVVSADLNNDGKPDLILTDGEWFGGPHTGRNRLRVHLNQLETGNHWIGAKLASSVPGVSTIGAKVWAKTKERTAIAQIVTGDSYQSQHPATVHFGLGPLTEVQELVVRWPNGKTNSLAAPTIDQYHRMSP